MKLTTNKDGTARKTKHDWHLVDWSMPTELIADMMGVTQQYVSGRRKKYAPETVRTVHQKAVRAEERWKGTDWSLTDAEIAHAMKVPRATVWKARRRHSLENAESIQPETKP